MIRSKGENVFNVFNMIFMGLLGVAFIFPVLFVLKTSIDIAPPTTELSLIPKNATLLFYRMLLDRNDLYRPFLNSIFITIVGTFGGYVFNCMGGYALTRRDLPGISKIVYYIVVIPMFVSSGLVPGFILYNSIGFYDTYYVLIIPGMLSAMNMIILRNNFWSIPKSLLESAKIDGAGEFTVFTKIMLPLSKASISAISMFAAVNYWNLFMQAIIYTESPRYITFAVKLHAVLFVPDANQGQYINNAIVDMGQPELLGTGINADALGAAMTIISLIPIIVAYPFMQKYFAAGMLKGSIKG